MRLKSFPALSILALSLASGCRGSLPQRPATPICMVSAPLPTNADPAPFQGCLCANAEGTAIKRLTFRECDKYVAVALPDFHALGDYVLAVEQQATGACKGVEMIGARADVKALREQYDRARKAVE